MKYQTKLTTPIKPAIITPIGVTEKFRRASGLSKGSTHRCTMWNVVIDIMAKVQHGITREKGVMVEDKWDKGWKLLTWPFVDDAHHCTSGKRRV